MNALQMILQHLPLGEEALTSPVAAGRAATRPPRNCLQVVIRPANATDEPAKPPDDASTGIDPASGQILPLQAVG